MINIYGLFPNQTIGIALIGNFHPEDGGVTPSNTLMQNVRNLIDCAVQDVSTRADELCCILVAFMLCILQGRTSSAVF